MRLQRLRGLAPGLAFVAAALGAGCSAPAAPAPQTHVDRVIEDVTAIIEGMVEAHSSPRGVAQIPDIRSLLPRS